jgi:hypothetical protein
MSTSNALLESHARFSPVLSINTGAAAPLTSITPAIHTTSHESESNQTIYGLSLTNLTRNQPFRSDPSSLIHSGDFTSLEAFLEQGVFSKVDLNRPVRQGAAQATLPQLASFSSHQAPSSSSDPAFFPTGTCDAMLFNELQRLTETQAVQLQELNEQLREATQQASYYQNLYTRELALSEQVMTSLVLLRQRHRNCSLSGRASTKVAVASSGVTGDFKTTTLKTDRPGRTFVRNSNGSTRGAVGGTSA